MKKILPIIIITCALALAISSVWEDSLIVDEIPHVGAGYSYWATGDMRLNPEHPPLVKDLAGLPLQFMDLEDEPAFASRFWNTDINGQWDFGRQLIFQSGNDADKVAHAAKPPVFIFFILAAWLLFKWIRERYGFWPGIVGLILFTFSPTVLAHARFVTTDLAAAWGILTATFFFLRYLEKPTWKNLLIAGLIFGLAQLTKFSVFLLVPYFGLLAIIWSLVKSRGFLAGARVVLGTILLMVVGYGLVVWPVYGLHTRNYPVELQQRDMQAQIGYAKPEFARQLVLALADKPYLRAFDQYLFGLLMVNQRQAGGNTIYYRGEVVQSGGPSYFPLVYFIKETLAFWAFVLLALLGVFLTKNYKLKTINSIREHFPEWAMLLWLIIYWGISIQSKLNIGVRHLLPVFPFTIILVTAGIASLRNKLRIENKKILLSAFYFLISILLGWQIYENVSIYPYYLTYFNQSAGGPENGYKIVVDSNLDWGQDLKRLTNFVEENNIEAIEVDYFGWSDPYYYLGQKTRWLHAGKYRSAAEFKASSQSDGWLALSATFKQNSKQNPATSYDWLDTYNPVAVIGHSIFVYHVK